MFQDSSLRRSVDEYIKRRIKEISLELSYQIPTVTKIWKCTNPVDFLYGYYLGKIEEGIVHYLLKATRGGTLHIDQLEIREMLESHRSELSTIIQEAYDNLRTDTNSG